MGVLLILLCLKFQLLSATGNAVQEAQENVEDVKHTQSAIYRMAQQDAKAAIEAAQENASAEIAAAPRKKKSAVRVEAADRVENVKQWEASVLEMAKSESQETIQAAKHRATAAVATGSSPNQPVVADPAAQEHLRTLDVQRAQKEALERAVTAADKAAAEQQAAEQAATAQRSQAQASQEHAAVQVAAANKAKQTAEKAAAAADERLKAETEAQDNAKLDEQRAVQAAEARAAQEVAAARRAKQSAQDKAKREVAAADTAKQAAAQATLAAQERVMNVKQTENGDFLKAKAEEQKASLEQERASAEMAKAEKEMKAASTAIHAVKEREKELAEHHDDASSGQFHPQLIMGLAISVVVAIFGLSSAVFLYFQSSKFSGVCQDLDERSNKVSLLEEEKTFLRQQLDELREDFTGMRNMVGMQQDMLNRQQDLTKELVHSNGDLSRQVSVTDFKPTRCRRNSSQSTVLPTDSSNSLGLSVNVAADSVAFATECARVRAQWLGLADSPPDSDFGAGDSDTEGSQSRSDSDLAPCRHSLPAGSQECAPSMFSAAMTSVKSLGHIIPALKFPVPSAPEVSNNLNYLEQGLLGDASFNKIGDEAWRDGELALEGDGALLQVDGSDKAKRNASPCLTSRSVESHKSNSTSASGKWWGGRMFLLSNKIPASQDHLAETPRVFQREGLLATKKNGKHLSCGPEKYDIGTSRGPQNYNIGTARGIQGP